VRPRRAELSGGARGPGAFALGLALAAAVAAAVFLGCATAAQARRAGAAPAEVQEGRASYYGSGFAGRRTASGERYDPRKMTAAHKTLRLGTWIRVTRTSGKAGGPVGPSVEVRINDRCGCPHGRIVDLSEAAAKRLRMTQAGVVPVRITVIRK
jgi:rare lipoprotein A